MLVALPPSSARVHLRQHGVPERRCRRRYRRGLFGRPGRHRHAPPTPPSPSARDAYATVVPTTRAHRRDGGLPEEVCESHRRPRRWRATRSAAIAKGFAIVRGACRPSAVRVLPATMHHSIPDFADAHRPADRGRYLHRRHDAVYVQALTMGAVSRALMPWSRKCAASSARSGIMEYKAEPEYDGRGYLSTLPLLREMMLPAASPPSWGAGRHRLLNPAMLGASLVAPSLPACSWPSLQPTPARTRRSTRAGSSWRQWPGVPQGGCRGSDNVGRSVQGYLHFVHEHPHQLMTIVSPDVHPCCSSCPGDVLRASVTMCMGLEVKDAASLCVVCRFGSAARYLLGEPAEIPECRRSA